MKAVVLRVPDEAAHTAATYAEMVRPYLEILFGVEIDEPAVLDLPDPVEART